MNGGFFGHALLFVTLFMLAIPSISAQNSLEKRGFRVPAYRKVVKNAIGKRSAGGGSVSYSDGGWYVSVLISGQDLVRLSWRKSIETRPITSANSVDDVTQFRISRFLGSKHINASGKIVLDIKPSEMILMVSNAF